MPDGGSSTHSLLEGPSQQSFHVQRFLVRNGLHTARQVGLRVGKWIGFIYGVRRPFDRAQDMLAAALAVREGQAVAERREQAPAGESGSKLPHSKILNRMKRRGLRAGFLVLAPLLCLAVWAFWIEPASLRNETYRLGLERWPEHCSPLRVAVLADLHVGSPFNGIGKLERVVSTAQAAKPDLILLGGDFVIRSVLGGTFVEPEAIAPSLARLSAPLGVYAVLGNHDWDFDAPRVRAALESHRIPVLEDRAVVVSRGRCSFWLAGIGDYWWGRHDVRAALEPVPADAPVLAFTHNPDVFPDIPSRVVLTIAAHTHGGQVALPFVGRPVIPSRYGQRYAIGHIVENGHDLFVTSGVGTSIIPVRFRVPPEVSVLDIVRVENTAS